MATTFTKIADVTVGAGGQSSISFTSIPSTFTDLVAVYSLRDSTGAGVYNDINITVNSQTAAAGRVLYTINGTSAASYSPTSVTVADNANASTANTFSNIQVYIPNYLSTGVKSASAEVAIENNAAGCNLQLDAFTITNGAAITTLTITALANFVQYSTATLYGISKS